MLRKAVVERGKEWDKSCPIYSSLTGRYHRPLRFFTLELLYGRPVHGPLDVLRQTWEGSKKSNNNIISYVLDMRKQLDKMTEVVKENLDHAQMKQKRWYDKAARLRQFEPGDRVLCYFQLIRTSCWLGGKAHIKWWNGLERWTTRSTCMTVGNTNRHSMSTCWDSGILQRMKHILHKMPHTWTLKKYPCGMDLGTHSKLNRCWGNDYHHLSEQSWKSFLRHFALTWYGIHQEVLRWLSTVFRRVMHMLCVCHLTDYLMPTETQ